MVMLMGKAIVNKYQVLYLLLTLYFCYDSNVNILRHPDCSIYITMLLTLILLIISIFNKKFIFNSKMLFLFLTFSFFTLLSGIIYNTNFNNLIYFVLIYFMMFLVSCCYTKNEFIKSFVYSVIIMCIMALIAQFILFPLYKNGLFYAKSYYIDNSYWPRIDFIISFCVPAIGTIQRMFSVFREPGVFQIFILFSLSFLLFCDTKMRYKKIFILILYFSLIMTFSTAGFLFGILLIISWFLRNNNDGISIKKKIYILILISLMFFLIITIIKSNQTLSFTFNRMIEKIIDNKENESFSVRYYSILNIMKASTINPITGMGWDYGLNYIINNLNQFGTRDVTGTTLIIAVVYGWPMCIITNLLLVKLFFQIHSNNNKISLFLNFIAIFLSINTQNILQNLFIWLLITLSLYKYDGGNLYEK